MSEVLVIEDDDAIRQLLVAALTRAGVAVAAARNGEEALERLNNQKVILLDLMLPRIDGWTVLREIGDRVKPRPIVIVMTAGAPFQKPLEPPPDLLVSKPFDINALVETVATCVRTLSAPAGGVNDAIPPQPPPPVQEPC